MNKLFTLIALSSTLLCANDLFAEDAFVTNGESKQYTFAKLAAIPESGVEDAGDGVFVMTKDVTITEDNTFSISGLKTLKMANHVTFTLNCYSDFNASDDARVLVTYVNENDDPCGIMMDYNGVGEDVVTFRNIDFVYAGLRGSGAKGFDIDNCTFTRCNGAISTVGAVTLGDTGAAFNITNSTFADCEVPAIGTPANYACAITIDRCTFTNNNASNTNKPQLNLTVGGDNVLTISNCVLKGAKLPMVGGIAVSNLTVLPGENLVRILNCDIRDHRYGITGVGPLKMEIRDNTLIDNRYENNPMNGGSGISLAGYNYGLDAIVSGNHIENSLWGITLIQCRDVNLGEVGNLDSPGGNVFINNGNGGVPYDLYNNQKPKVMAQLNTWSVPEQTAENIATVIFDASDNPALGEVVYMPAAEDAGVSSPVNDGSLLVAGGKVCCDRPVSITDVSGKTIVVDVVNPDLRSLQPGIYVIRSGREVTKLMVK